MDGRRHRCRLRFGHPADPGADPARQYAVLVAALVLLLALRRGVVLTLLCAAAAGVILALAGIRVHVSWRAARTIEAARS